MAEDSTRNRPMKWDVVRAAVHDRIMDKRIYGDGKKVAIENAAKQNQIDDAPRVRRKLLEAQRFVDENDSILFAITTALKVFSIGSAIYAFATAPTEDRPWATAHLVLTSVVAFLHGMHTLSILSRPKVLRERSKSLLYTPYQAALKIVIGLVGLSTVSVMLAKHAIRGKVTSTVTGSVNVIITCAFVMLDVLTMRRAFQYKQAVKANVAKLIWSKHIKNT